MPENESHQKRKIPLRGKLSSALEFPSDAVGGVSCVSVMGCHEVTIYGCRCVASYECEEVVLSLCDGVLHIDGSSLEMKTFASGVIRLGGRIDQIRFEEKKSEK